MSWNYRVVRVPGGGLEGADDFGIREVYYKGETPTGMTEPITFTGESPESVAKTLEMALKDARERPVFDPPADWL